MLSLVVHKVTTELTVLNPRFKAGTAWLGYGAEVYGSVPDKEKRLLSSLNLSDRISDPSNFLFNGSKTAGHEADHSRA